MNLFCSSCREIHKYTPTDIERLIYALQLAEYDAAISQEDKSRNWLDLLCLDNVLSLAHDSEGYAEVINESLLPSRKELVQLR